MTGFSDSFDQTSAAGSGPRGDRTENGDTEEIREQIKDTRSRMSNTLDQLGERLNPRVVKEQLTEHVKDSIREATVGRVSQMARQAKDQVMSAERSLIRTARENPIPAAMIGIGLAWIILNRRRGSDGDGYSTSASRLTDYDQDAPRYDLDTGSMGPGSQSSGPMESESTFRQGVEKVKEQAAEIGETIKDKAAAVGERTSEIASRVGDSTKRMATAVGDSTKRMASAVARGSKRQYQRVEETFYENPLAIGAIALAAGLAVGLSVPRTETESKLMGDASERLTDRARDAVRETKDKVQHVAERVLEEGKRTAGEALREEGLTARV